MTPDLQHAGRPAETATGTATVALDGAGDRDRLGRATGTNDPYLRERLINDMLGCLALAGGAGVRDAEDAVRAALAALESLAPADAADGMLAVQTVACHAAAMECLRRAARDEGPPAARDWNLRHAERLMALCERQLAALDRRREARRARTSADGMAAGGTPRPAAGAETGRRPTASAEPPATARPHLAGAGAGSPDTGQGTGRGTGHGLQPERGNRRLKDRLLGGAAAPEIPGGVAAANAGLGGTARGSTAWGGAPPPGRSP